MEEIRIEDIKKRIQSGKTVLGIELGSTRIKGVLLTEEGELIADGSHQWENRLENGIWTYSMEAVWKGMQECYGDLKTKVREAYGAEIETIGGIGISAMMHGYLAFDGNDELLVPFRTWRNTITEQASRELTECFNYPIPQRWSIAHLYQAVLNGEAHVKDIKYITTLAGYVHWMLTGERVLGVDDASGMFPVDAKTGTYYTDMLDCFDQKISDRSFHGNQGNPAPASSGRGAGRRSYRGGCRAFRSGRNIEGRNPPVPPGRRCGNRDGCNKQRKGAHRQCIRRNLHIFHDRTGKRAFKCIF